ncbi:MAG: hypothetical protein FGM24_08380 [Candidatus Kapabacteria bacterium]|nr:hypothetical protein [Candidatus Kapabacteria bacterium]
MKHLQRPEFATMALIVVLAASRLLPHWPNVTPVMAMALMGGALLPSTRKAMLVPLAAMLLSDLALGALLGWEYALHSTQAVVYGTFLLTTLMGRWLRRTSMPMQVLGGGSVAAVLFFLVTNGAVWATSTMYPHTFAGLLLCYEAGLAFYRDSGNFFLNGLVSTWLFAGIIAVGTRLATRQRVAAQAL